MKVQMLGSLTVSGAYIIINSTGDNKLLLLLILILFFLFWNLFKAWIWRQIEDRYLNKKQWWRSVFFQSKFATAALLFFYRKNGVAKSEEQSGCTTFHRIRMDKCHLQRHQICPSLLQHCLQTTQSEGPRIIDERTNLHNQWLLQVQRLSGSSQS